MPPEQIVTADLVWTGNAFEPEVHVRIDPDGRIAEVGTFDVEPTLVLDGQALLPGMVSSHSHAFQRGLRGRGETFPEGAGSFWTWREAMYGLVASLDPDSFYRLCRATFTEMLACGITTVGEFHYVHHDRGDDHAFDALILRAAADAGIRIALLQAYYNTGAIGQPLAGAQIRFRGRSAADYLAQLDHLETLLDGERQSLGVVVHSIRAASVDDLVELHGQAKDRGLVFHMHLEEQRQEIEDCLTAYGKRPMALLCERLEIDRAFTAVHCTHSDPRDLERFLAAGGNVSICPLTEANLGDGIADVPAFLSGDQQLSIGTDSNSRLSMAEEMRWLEYAQRLSGERRGVCRASDGQVATTLFDVATLGGARSLALDVGRIAPRCWADFFTLDLAAPSLDGWTADTLLASFIFGARDEAVRRVCVGGRWIS